MISIPWRHSHGLLDGKRHLLYKMWLFRKQYMNHGSQVQWCMLSKVLWSLPQTANLASPAWGEFVIRVQLTYCMVQMFICTLIHNKTLHSFVHYQLCQGTRTNALKSPRLPLQHSSVTFVYFFENLIAFAFLKMVSLRNSVDVFWNEISRSFAYPCRNCTTLWRKVLPCGSRFLAYPAIWIWVGTSSKVPTKSTACAVCHSYHWPSLTWDYWGCNVLRVQLI